MWTSRWAVAPLSVLLACSASTGAPDIGGESAGSIAAGWHEIRFDAATLSARRPDGQPWHKSEGSRAGSIFGSVAALALGYPLLLGRIVGRGLDEKPTPLAPAPYVVLRVGPQALSVLPARRTYAPRWTEAIALASASLDPDATAVLQVMDDIDDSLLGQKALPVRELLATGTRTLLDVGAVSSLTMTVIAHEPREPIELRLKVSADAAVRDLPFVEVWNGDQVEVTARGRVCPSSWDPQLCVGPGGTRADFMNYNLPEASADPHAALIAVMADGAVLLGEAATLTVEHTGPLYFRANDKDPDNNTGAFEVHVRVVPGTLAR